MHRNMRISGSIADKDGGSEFIFETTLLATTSVIFIQVINTQSPIDIFGIWILLLRGWVTYKKSSF